MIRYNYKIYYLERGLTHDVEIHNCVNILEGIAKFYSRFGCLHISKVDSEKSK